MLIIEDGTGLTNANAYVSVLDADTYFSDRGIESWALLSDLDKESAIIIGTECADMLWGHLLQGRPLLSAQALEFPRTGVYDRYGELVGGVPGDWIKAVLYYTRDAYNNASSSDTGDTGDAGDKIKRKKTVVGPISTEIEYHAGVDALSNSNAGNSGDKNKADHFARQFTVAGQASSGRVIRA